MILRFFIVFIICLVNSVSNAQKPENKIRESKLSFDVDRISVDRLGGFYLIGHNKIEKYTPDGIKAEITTLINCDSITLIEGWNPSRIFAFEKNKRAFHVLSHDLTLSDQISIDSAAAIEPLLATPSNDNRTYWVLDIDYSLKKVDNITSKVLVETEPIVAKGKYRFTHMREFQNYIFMLDELTGIYVFNNVGKLVKHIPCVGVKYFSVLGEDIYFLNQQAVHFFDIYSEDMYQVPLTTKARFVIATDEKLIIIQQKIMEVFNFRPRQ